MKKHLNRIILIVLLAVLAVSCGMIVNKLIQYKQAATEIEEARQFAVIVRASDLAVSDENTDNTHEELDEYLHNDTDSTDYDDPDPNINALREVDFAGLQEINPQVKGWIYIPDTDISYPLMQTTNNDYYLGHSWKKSKNLSGSIYLDYRNSDDFSDFNTYIYGHNMSDGSMFSGLHSFYKKDYFNEHPYVYICSPEKVYRFDIFALLEPSVDSPTFAYSFNTDQDKQYFIDYSLRCATRSSDAVPTINDHILTLSTCTGRGHETRWVIQAVLSYEVPFAPEIQE